MIDSYATYDSPLGPLTLIGSDAGLRRICFPGQAPAREANQAPVRQPECLRKAIAQLEQYFAGARRSFELELELTGTPFQRRVWSSLQRIPYGSTTSYGELARTLGEELGRDPLGPRAVGAAVGRTPTPIVVPCHRVLGADGSLTGYGGGLERKRALLGLEGSGGAVALAGSARRRRRAQLQLV